MFVQEGCGFQPRGVASHVYHLSSTHCLVGTAEIPLAGTPKKEKNVDQNDEICVFFISSAMYMNSALPLEKLPIRSG